MLTHHVQRAISLLVPIALIVLAGCEALQDNPGRIAFSLSWDEQPDGLVYIWLRIEERAEGPEISGPTLASAGPAEYENNKPLSLTMGEVSNGKNRVVVVEVRKGSSTELPVLFFGISEPFTLGPGMHVKVDVPLKIQKPDTQTHEADMSLLFAGESADTVGAEAIKEATVMVRSVAADQVVMANDASFSANLMTVDLVSGEGVDCTQEEEDELAWDECQIGPWDLTAGLPDNIDGQYTIYAKFVDQHGYESAVQKVSVTLDSTPPSVLVASLSPKVIHTGQSAVVTATFHEELAADGVGTEFISVPDSTGVLLLDGPTRIGTTTTYAWTATVAPEADTEVAEFTFSVAASDLIGNLGTHQPLNNVDGEALTLILDVVGPRIVAPVDITFNRDLFGIPGEVAGQEEEFIFDFVFQDDSAQEVTQDADGICQGNCPEVRLGGKKLGTVLLDPSKDYEDKGHLGFSFEYLIDTADWGAIEQTLDVSIVWSDQAGNQTLSTLDQTVRFDFLRPSATLCNLVPEKANASSVITYSITVSEPLTGIPVLVKGSDAESLFSGEPTVVGSQTFVWEQAALDISLDEVSLAADLLDLAGNASADPVCPESVQVDSVYPQLLELQVSTQPEVVNGQGSKVLTVGLEDTIEVAFEVDENQQLEAGFPEVSLNIAGIPVAMKQQSASEDNGKLQFKYSLTFGAEDAALEEGLWPATITLQDTSGNTTVAQAQAEEFVKLDFTAPLANCTVLGQNDTPFAIGETITLQISPNEELAAETMPALTVSMNPPDNGNYFQFVEESSYWFTHIVNEGEGGKEFTVEVGLTDLVGNQTPDGANACVAGPLLGAMDGQSPQVVGSQIVVSTLPQVTNAAGATVLAAGLDDSIRVAFTMDENKELAAGYPKVALSVAGLPVPMEQISMVEQEGLVEFEYNITLGPEDVTLDEGLWPATITLQDTSGNTTVTQAQAEDFIKLDFTAPVANCTVLGLNDTPFAIGETITLQISPSEELAAETMPALTVSMNPPDDGTYFQFVEESNYWFTHLVSEGEGDKEFTVEVGLTDLVGNQTPDGANACVAGPLLGAVDGQSPLVVGSQIVVSTLPQVTNAAGATVLAAGLDDSIRVAFTMDENKELAAGYPKVALSVAGLPVPMEQISMVEQKGLVEFEYNITLGPEDVALDEGLWPATITLQDTSGNTTVAQAQAEDFVKLDFTAPVANCTVLGQDDTPFAIGETITLQISPNEELVATTKPVLAVSLDPPADGDYFQFVGESNYWYTHIVADGEGEKEFSVAVQLTDLVGNVTLVDGNACQSGPLSGLVDGQAPAVVGVELVVPEAGYENLDRPLKVGIPVQVTVQIENSGLLPAVTIGSQPMTPLSLQPEELGGDLFQFVFERTLDGTEGEGPQVLSVDGADAAGNDFSYTQDEAQLTFDFQAPLAYCFLFPTAAKGGDKINLTVSTSEPLMDNQPELVADMPFQLDTVDSDSTDFVFLHEVLVGALDKPQWNYSITVTDLAGNINEKGTGCTGTGSIDSTLPTVVDGEEGITVNRRHLNDHATLTVDFTLTEGEVLIKDPTVKLGTANLDVTQSDQGIYTYSYTAHKDGDSPDQEGTYALSITLMDKAGNVQIYTPGTVTFDFTPPSVEDSSIVFSPPAGCRLEAVTAMTHGSLLDLTIVVDDQLKEPPVVTITGELLGAKPVPNTDPEDPYRVVFHHQFNGGDDEALPNDLEETAEVQVALTDPSENIATFTIGQVPIDTLLPPLPDTETPGKIIYTRVPWGNSSTSGKKAFQIRGEPGSTAPGCHVLAFDGIHVDESFLIGQTMADENGAFGGEQGSGSEFNLTLADRERVYLLTVDPACNEADANAIYAGIQGTSVLDAELVVSPGLRIPGDDLSNPNVFYERVWFDNRADQDDQLEPDNAADLASSNGTGIATTGGGTWQQWDFNNDLPEPREHTAMAWDSNRQVMVMFGGTSAAKTFDDTWEWDGSTWTEITPDDPELDGNPPPLASAAMTFDEIRDRMVLFGGMIEGADNDLSNQTWEWDGHSWWLRTPLDPENDGNPKARSRHTMLFSPFSSKVLSYGGDKGGGQMWEWDGSSWDLYQNGDTPGIRMSHSMAYDTARQRIVVYGGVNIYGGDFANTWEFDGSKWAEIPPVDILGDGNPTNQDGTTMIYSPVHQRVLMWDGRPGTWVVDNLIWAWDGQEWEVFQPSGHGSGPPAMIGMSFIYHPGLQTVVMFGGRIGAEYWSEYSDQLWLLPGDNESWTLWQLQDPDLLPPGVHGHTIGYDPLRGITMIAGGHGAESWNDECSEFDGWKWIDSPCPTQSGSGRKATFDLDDGRLLVVGGADSQPLSAYAWDGETAESLVFTDPENDGNPVGRHDHSLAYDPVHHETIVFGGLRMISGQPYTLVEDTWLYNGESWRLWQVDDPEGDGSPNKRYDHHMTWDYATDTVMMLGGTWANVYNGGPSGLQWQWTGASWVKVEPPDPEDDGSPMSQGSHIAPIVGVEELGRVLAVSDGELANHVLWQWNGVSWRNLVHQGDLFGHGLPPHRDAPGIVWETHRGRLLTFGGGLPVGASGDLWFWWPGTKARPGHTFTVQAGGSGIGLKDLKSVHVTWKAGASGIDDDGPVNGAGLFVWRGNTWVLVDSNEAGADSSKALTWSTNDQRTLLSMMEGQGRQLRFSVIPTGWNGADYASVFSASMEVALSYRPGANCDCDESESCNSSGECVEKCGDGLLDPSEGCEYDFECDEPDVCYLCICQPLPSSCTCGEAVEIQATPDCEMVMPWPPPYDCSAWMEMCMMTVPLHPDYCMEDPPVFHGTTRCLGDCCITLMCE
jgi:hypothetical protein